MTHLTQTGLLFAPKPAAALLGDPYHGLQNHVDHIDRQSLSLLFLSFRVRLLLFIPKEQLLSFVVCHSFHRIGGKKVSKAAPARMLLLVCNDSAEAMTPEIGTAGDKSLP